MSPDGDLELIRAEAAAWLARLRSDSARPEDQAGFRAWLTRDERHAQAFEAITATWDAVGGLKLSRPMRPAAATGPDRRGVLIGGVLAVAAASAGAAYWYNRDRPEIYATARGEQRRLLLGDGSRLVLDTDTQITARLGKERRQIVLDRGRAYFDVAPNPHRPFAVVAGAHEVVALGTAFDVTFQSGVVSATLEHGRIAVSGDATELNDYMLSPGDRIVFAADGETTRDRPDIALTMAWRTGRLGFDRETLGSAVAEMNHYSARPLVIGDPQIAHFVISGLYTAGDNDAFAKSVSALLPVIAEVGPKEIVLMSAKKMRDPG